MQYIPFLIVVALILFFAGDMYHHVKKLNTVRRLIDTYEHDTENPKVIDEMYDYCLQDRKLKKIMAKYNPTKKDFDMIYHKLLMYGNFRKINRFVPISSFFAAYTLEYLLKNKDLDAFTLTKRTMNFFNI